MALVLASQSPRRRELMSLVTPDFVTDESAVDESAIIAASPALLAQKLAVAKACDVLARRPCDVVVGCDTVVEIEGEALGKPQNEQQAAAMLERLAGKAHKVHTGVCIAAQCLPQPCSFIETTCVFFTPIPTGRIADYVKTNEPYDKAGGYAIQGWAARYISRIEGCYYNVMGLPVSALYRQLAALECHM